MLKMTIKWHVVLFHTLCKFKFSAFLCSWHLLCLRISVELKNMYIVAYTLAWINEEFIQPMGVVGNRGGSSPIFCLDSSSVSWTLIAWLRAWWWVGLVQQHGPSVGGNARPSGFHPWSLSCTQWLLRKALLWWWGWGCGCPPTPPFKAIRAWQATEIGFLKEQAIAWYL